MGEVTNCIIQVQSKATEQAFEGDTRNTFEYRFRRRISISGWQAMPTSFWSGYGGKQTRPICALQKERFKHLAVRQ
ncbi:MAG: hypothetical protein ACR2JB_23830 [Bryobacteraceae bacterium]